MRVKPLIAILVATGLIGCQARESAESEVSLDQQEQQIGYAMGVNLARQILGDGLDFDRESFVAGLEDGWDDSVRLSEEQLSEALTAFQQQETERRRAEAEAQSEQEAALGESNRQKAEAFFAENAQREGVQTTASGLQYEVLKQAEGARPSASDVVSVHYRGTLLDGAEFDSSYARGEPATFPLNRVIAGWTEGVQLMAVGSSYRFFIPSELAYGPGGAGGMIGPDAALIFDVELLAIEGAE